MGCFMSWLHSRMQPMPWRNAVKAGIREVGCVWKLLEGKRVLKLVKNGGSTLAKNGSQNSNKKNSRGKKKKKKKGRNFFRPRFAPCENVKLQNKLLSRRIKTPPPARFAIY